MGKMIGIDLGTTNSVVAICDGPLPRIIDNRAAKSQTRSVVGLKRRKSKGVESEPEILVGDAALDNWPLAPRDTIISIKRLMGRGVSDSEVERVRSSALYEVVQASDGTRDSVRVVIGGKQYSPIEVSAIILKKLKEDAEFRLGEEVTHAVVTVPAYFSQIQRDATRRAGLLAGLRIIKILDEPTAAAIAFGIDTGDGTPKTLLVYDLGGGTFDISVLMWAGNVYAPMNLEGDMWLGGDNFDEVLVNHVAAHVEQEYGVNPRGNMRFMVELKRSAQAVKERLGSSRSADLIVAGLLQDGDGNLIDVEMEITRDEFERLITPLVEKTVTLTLKAIREAQLTPDQIDYVLMAGNSTSVPLVQQAMERVFGPHKVMRNIHPKHCVALGAAVAAARIGGIVCQAPDPATPGRDCGHVNAIEATRCDNCGTALEASAASTAKDQATLVVGGIAPYPYGAQSAGDRFNVFIEDSEPYPTESPKTKTFPIPLANARMLSIPVYGGDNVEKASLNEKQGEAFAILPPGLPEKTLVRVKLWLDQNGIFGLSAHLEDGTDLKPWVVKGDADARVIQILENTERVLALKQKDLSAQEAAAVETNRNRVFEAMANRNFEAALHEANNLQQAANSAGQNFSSRELQNNISYIQFTLNRYDWLIQEEQTQRLKQLMDQSRAAIDTGNAQAMDQFLRDTDAAIDNLPEGVRIFLGMRGRIHAHIHPQNPKLAQDLVAEAESIEQAFRARQPNAQQLFDAFSAKLTAKLKEVAPQSRGPACSNGHAMPQGERYCPVCREDTWLLGSQGAHGAGR